MALILVFEIGVLEKIVLRSASLSLPDLHIDHALAFISSSFSL